MEVLGICVFPHQSLDAVGNTVHSWDSPVVDIVVLGRELLMLGQLEVVHIHLGMLPEACYPLVYRELACRSTLPTHWGRVVTFGVR